MSLTDVYPEIDALVDKWSRILNSWKADKELKRIAAILLENQMCLISASDRDIGVVGKYAIPMILRFLDVSIARCLVSCQPVLDERFELQFIEQSVNRGMVSIREGKKAPDIDVLTQHMTVNGLIELKSLVSEDAISELMSIVADGIASEIDNRIIKELRCMAKPAGETAFSGADALNDITKGCHAVFMNSRRAMASWVVAPPTYCEMLIRDRPQWFVRIEDGRDHVRTHAGPKIFGSIKAGNSGIITVIKDPKSPPDELLFGYQGPCAVDTGYIWGPQTLFDPIVDKDGLPIKIDTHHAFARLYDGFFAEMKIAG